MTHWLAEQMPKGRLWSVGTLVGPGGTVWSVGDKVVMLPFNEFHRATPTDPTEIETINPGDGDWRAAIPGGDTDAVWFGLANGWWARPWLVRKL